MDGGRISTYSAVVNLISEKLKRKCQATRMDLYVQSPKVLDNEGLSSMFLFLFMLLAETIARI